MLWFLLYIPAFYLLWQLMEWDSKGRTNLSYAILLFYACALVSAVPLYGFVQMLKQTPRNACDQSEMKN